MSSIRLSRILLTLTALIMPAAPAIATGNIHEQITGPFSNAQAVTTQCLTCHAKQGADILQSTHWTWVRSRGMGTGEQRSAKKSDLTTYALDVEANPGRCMTCHISTTLLSGKHDPTSATDIDCLVCHDTTGTYRRTFGAPASTLDLVLIAANVGKPKPGNCLTCHGKACGLTGLSGHDGFTDDVHLKKIGAALTCQHCHPSAGKHLFPRQADLGEGRGAKATGCSGCHTTTPHAGKQLNSHAKTIACQTCHIPVFGRGTPALISWNWLIQPSTELFQQQTAPVPLFNKNGMTLASDVLPVYFWDNGDDRIYVRGERVDPAKMTVLMQPSGREPASQIKPFAARYGTQLYDAKYRYLISPALTKNADTFFVSTDWNRIAGEGMNSLRLPYSGSYGFITTATFRRLNHGVAPAASALDCLHCHGRQGRMPWGSLGYPQDPWNDQQSVSADAAPFPQQERPSAPTPSP